MAENLLADCVEQERLRSEPLGRVSLCRHSKTGERYLRKELFLPQHLPEGVQEELRFNARLALRALESADSHCALQPVATAAGDSEPVVLFPAPEGPTLAQALDEGRRFTAVEALRLGLDSAAALRVLQENQIAPPCVDPQNVYLRVGGGAVWAELGFSHYLRESLGAPLPGSADDLRFQSPEQAAGGAVSDASLTYSLGMLVYALVTGLPAEREGQESVLARIRQEDYEPLWRFTTDLSREADEVLSRALAPAPADRYATVAELHEALQHLLPADETQPGGATEPAAEETDSAAETPARPSLLAALRGLPKRTVALGAAVLVLLALAGSLLFRPPGAPSSSTSPPAETPAAAPTSPTPTEKPVTLTPAPPTPAPADSHSSELPSVRYRTPPRAETTTLPVAQPRSAESSTAATRRQAAPNSSQHRRQPTTSSSRTHSPAPRRQTPKRRAEKPPVREQPTAEATPKRELPAAEEVRPEPRERTREGLPPGVKRRF